MKRLPTRCCGFRTVVLLWFGDTRRFVLSKIDQRDMSTLHRQVKVKAVVSLCVCLGCKHLILFIFFPLKVVCKESIWNSRAYWEVKYSGWVVIGATYEGAGRRADSGPSGLGENEESWGLCWSGLYYQIWFNGVHRDIKDVPFCSTVGVYIDQPAGIINFYIVTGEGAEREVMLVHKVKTTIKKKILPGFWVGIQSSCTLLKKTE